MMIQKLRGLKTFPKFTGIILRNLAARELDRIHVHTEKIKLLHVVRLPRIGIGSKGQP